MNPSSPSGTVAQELKSRIEDQTASIGVVGLGYVGLPLVRAVHEAGYSVIGYDKDDAKIELLRRGENYLGHLGQELTQDLAASDRFLATWLARACDTKCRTERTP